MELNLERITKSYKKQFTLQDISCQMNTGIYGLVGPNGAGKTTLLRILATILQPDKGRILIDGQDVSRHEEAYRSLIGYLPQKLGYYKHYSVTKFLQYISALKGLSNEETDTQITKLLHEFNLTQHANHKIKTLSEGVKQRIGIAQALLNDPKLLILDEPTLNLDPKERINFGNNLARLSTDRIILLSTHIISDIAYIAKEIILLDQGKIRASATPKQLLKDITQKVWEAHIASEKLQEIQHSYNVTDIRNANDLMKVRIISDKKPHLDCNQAEAELDDLYMYYFRKESTPC